MATLLVVEDEADIREVLIYLLGRDHSVFSASDGKEGLRLFQSQRPDIVITDLYMPEMSGFEMVKQIRELNSEAKIIVISAFLGKETERLSQIGANVYLSKPIDFDRLENSVKDLLA